MPNVHHKTFVCLQDRTSARSGRGHLPVCPVCGTPMRELGTRWRLPARTDDRGWREVREALKRYERYLGQFGGHGAPKRPEGRVSEYRADYTPRRIVRRPGA